MSNTLRLAVARINIQIDAERIRFLFGRDFHAEAMPMHIAKEEIR